MKVKRPLDKMHCNNVTTRQRNRIIEFTTCLLLIWRTDVKMALDSHSPAALYSAVCARLVSIRNI